MRIISGKYKGHHLVSFQADHIRPTTDRVKETLFNKWMGLFENANVLDLFSGTGNLGLEALSRDALKCTFVDSSQSSMTILKKNIAKLKIEAKDYQLINKNVFQFLKAPGGDQTFDFIFIDPPFTEKLAHKVMESLSESNLFHEKTLIAIESIKQERMDDQYRSLKRYDVKNYGDKNLSLFEVSLDSV
jgi:16S rRNA (guanine966-N2)-methyltransferase